MILYHGTTERAGLLIQKIGFKRNVRRRWKIKSKEGFVYLSLAYAPFFAQVYNKGEYGALVRCRVDEDKLYPDDDYVMDVIFKKPVYTQEDLDKVNLEDFKSCWKESLQYLGNVSAKVEDVTIEGVRIFDIRKLLFVCDPTITRMNYKIMGSYYKKLTEHIYLNGNFDSYLGRPFVLSKEELESTDIKQKGSS